MRANVECRASKEARKEAGEGEEGVSECKEDRVIFSVNCKYV